LDCWTNYNTTSDADGNWRLESVPEGFYDVYFFKPGYDTTIYYAATIVGSGNTYWNSNIIYEIPKTKVVLDSLVLLDLSDTSHFDLI